MLYEKYLFRFWKADSCVAELHRISSWGTVSSELKPSSVLTPAPILRLRSGGSSMLASDGMIGTEVMRNDAG